MGLPPEEHFCSLKRAEKMVRIVMKAHKMGLESFEIRSIIKACIIPRPTPGCQRGPDDRKNGDQIYD